ncbi:hypothetical protein J7T55_011053 [Diaporthe amygdali]|uniref:uncharacterized protein n=1 Tax=Phomopsis amygdali TaxID=1214568 RepID=UPI0022FE2E95|nr:uncharacterized protein J7T55_011053 [Diaporthe amygdali]KAJ0106958.1 hypothetical protein J7T55_011053 [Diaporthe amygdali]
MDTFISLPYRFLAVFVLMMLSRWLSLGSKEDVAHLHDRMNNFDVNEYWSRHGHAPDNDATDIAHAIHNGYDGVASARQLTETVDQFLARLPPATTRVTLNCPWIYIWNPFVPSDRIYPVQGDGDTVGRHEATNVFSARAQKRLDVYRDFVEKNRTKTGRISAKIRVESRRFTDEVLELASQLSVTEGKWVIFPSPEHCNDVWAKVAHATANGELGIAAKISPREVPDRHRLVCVYTRDFNDKDDVARVLMRLKKLGLVRQRQICYKTEQPDAFTHLGINQDNNLGLDVGQYRSNEIFAYLEGKV